MNCKYLKKYYIRVAASFKITVHKLLRVKLTVIKLGRSGKSLSMYRLEYLRKSMDCKKLPANKSTS